MTRDLVPLLEVPQHRPWATVRWLRRQVADRKIAYHRVGGRVLIDLTDLDTYAERGRVEPTAPSSLRALRSRRAS